MTKIDLSGDSGWQSKSGDRKKEIEKGAYQHEMVELLPDNLVTDWVKPGVMVRVEEGELTLISNGEEMDYDKDDIIVFNKENAAEFEFKITAKVRLEIMSAK